MNIHEYQAKNILKRYGAKVPNGYLVESIEELEKNGRKIQTNRAVVKAQIHAGGRGKAGGVKLVDSLENLISEGTRLLGSNLVTHQTGINGKRVNKIYLEETCEIIRELYLSMIIDRVSGNIAIIASKHGGMDIEEVSEKTPEAIKTVIINPVVGLSEFQIREVNECLALNPTHIKKLHDLLKKLYKCFTEKDCEMIEINPLVVDPNEDLVVLDCKMSFDDNAIYRHKDIIALRDTSEESVKELEASSYNLSYISLEGDIGCLVNGAGLAMATMDAIHQAGGEPANFLDVGGSASVEQVKNACLITMSDNVKGLFVNIFGGIMHCDTVAKGILNALMETEKYLPVVVRLEGTNIEQGLEILKTSSYDIQFASNMDEGAEIIVNKIKGEVYEHMG